MRFSAVFRSFRHRVTYRELTRRKKRNAVFTAHSCQGGDASIHSLESKSQQVHKLLSSFFKKAGYSWVSCDVINFSGGQPLGPTLNRDIFMGVN